MHRDFHVSNIMYFNKNFFLIDNQDAVFGNKVYDLASLIDDVRIKISLKNREKLYKAYVKKTKQKNKYVLRNDFEILSILRNLKIIGIFTRLSQRDKKHSYLKMIPYAWKMIDDRRKTNSKAKELNVFIDKYFPKKDKDERMKINTALILCAGYGKRLNPITLSLPKPLIEIRDRSLLSRTIELIISLGIKNIKINSFYLSDQIVECIRNSNYKNNIEIINDGDFILDTGGGVKNMIQYFKQDDFLVFNPDTIWDINYKDTIIKMIDYYYENKLSNLLLVANKKKF